MGNKVSLEDEMINLRIVSKQMQRSAKKCEKNEKAALDKLKKVRKQKQDWNTLWRIKKNLSTHSPTCLLYRPFNKEIMKVQRFTDRMPFVKRIKP
jgi:nitrate/nitrite-specific signal transduction histidine kinase